MKINNQQILVITLVFITFLFYSFLRITTESHDFLARIIIKISTIQGSLWVAFVIVFAVINGIEKKPVEAILLKARVLFKNQKFLIISLIFFLLLDLALLQQLVFYRQVEFISEEKVIIFENPKPDKIKEVGLIEANETTKFRLRIGDKFLFYELLSSDRRAIIDQFKVYPVWKKQDRIKIKKIKSFEKI